MEISQHSRYTCTFCGKNAVKRQAVGIWECRSCKKTVAGGAWTVSYVRPTLFAIRQTNELEIQDCCCRCFAFYHPSSPRACRGVDFSSSTLGRLFLFVVGHEMGFSSWCH